MSIQEQAAQLRNITLPFGAIQQAMQELDDARNQASQILGEGGSKFTEVNGAVEQAKAALDTAYAMVHEVESKFGEVADYHAQG